MGDKTRNIFQSLDANLIYTETSRIIALHHEDVPDAASFQPDGSNPFASNSLAHVATTLISLKSSEAIRQDQEDLRNGVVAAKEFCYLSVHGNVWDSAVCEIEHKRKSGKVAREVRVQINQAALEGKQWSWVKDSWQVLFFSSTFHVSRKTNAYHLGSPIGDLVVVNVWDVVGDMPDIDKLDLEESQTVMQGRNAFFRNWPMRSASFL